MLKIIKRFAAATISLALASVMLLSLPAWAQNLAEAARQERERRKEHATSHHIYTNEDLAKPRILIPEDQARVVAHNTGQSTAVIVATSNATTDPASGVSQPSSSLPIPGVTLASQAPIVSRGSVAVPAPPDPIRAAVASSVDALATAPVKLSFPFAESSAPKFSERLSGNEPQAPSLVTAAESAQFRATTPDVRALVTLPAQMSFPSAESSAPKFPERLSENEPQAPPIVNAAEGAQFRGTTLDVDALVTLPAQLSFTSADSFSPKLSDRSSGKEPQSPSIPYPVASGQAEAARSDVRVGFPSALVVPLAMPKEPLAAEHSLATPPAIRPASCAGTCSGLIEIVSAQPVAPVQPAAKTVRIQPAISPKPEPIKPRPVPVNASLSQVRVAIGDSLWKLAKRYLGDGNHWRELAALNRRLPNPGLIRPGELIQLPARGPEQARQVVVQPGDTLWTVAETALGSPLAFNCIAHANPQLQSADVIHPGQTLLVPETCAVEPAEKDRAGGL